MTEPPPLLTQDEIRRRMRAFLATPTDKRPCPVTHLEDIAGIGKDNLKNFIKKKKMHMSTHVALNYAFRLLEQGRLKSKTEILPDAKPPQSTVKRVEFTKHGPRVRFVALNPNAFEQLDAQRIDGAK